MRADLDRLMEERGIDAVMTIQGENEDPVRTYLANGVDFHGMVLKKRGAPPVLIANPMERDEAAKSGLQVFTWDKLRYSELLQCYPEYASRKSFPKELEGYVNAHVSHVSPYDRERLVNTAGMVRVLIENTTDPVIVTGNPGLLVAPDGEPGALTRNDGMLVLQVDNGNLLVDNAPWERNRFRTSCILHSSA